MKPLDFPSRLVRALPALAAILVFVQVLGAEFVYDDLVLLRDNPFLRNWSALWQGFDQPFWRMVGDDRIHSGFFRPLATASFTLLWKVGGGAPWVFHGASLLLHALASSMVAGLGLALGFRTRVAIFAGVLFAVHGAHAEPVAWASSLPDLLATVFCLASLLSWLRERSWMTAAWLLAALLTKESSIGILLLLVAHSLFQSIDRRKNLAPLLLVAAVVWLLRVRAWGGDWTAGFGIETTRSFLEPLQQAGLSLHLILQYLGFLAFPWPHVPFQPLRLDFGPGEFAWWTGALLSLGILIGAALLWLKKREQRTLAVPLGVLFACLIPVLNTSSLGQFPFEERFLYLPSVGFALLVSPVFFRLPSSLRFPLSGAALLLLTLSSVTGAGKWKKEETLYSWAIEASPNTMTPRLEYGRLLLDRAQGMPEGNPERLEIAERALRVYEASLEIDPDKWFVTALDRERGNVGLGNSLLVGGDLQTAELVYRKILQDPDGGGYPFSAEAHQGLGVVLAARGEALGKRARKENDPSLQTRAEAHWEEALVHYSRAVDLQPLLQGARYGLGGTLAFLRRYEEALPHLDHAFEADPANFEFARGLAEVQVELGKLHSAVRTLESHLSLVPSTPYRAHLEATVADIRRRMRSIQEGSP